MDTYMDTLSQSGHWHGVGHGENGGLFYLPIAYEYRPLFQRLTAALEALASHFDATPKQHALLAKLRYALARLPVLTRGVDFSVILADPLEPVDDWQTYTLEINQREVRATQMFYSHPRWNNNRPRSRIVFHYEYDGYRHDDGDDGYVSYADFEHWVLGWESLCQQPQSRLIIHNRQEVFDWHQVDDPLAWERMPSLFDGSR